MHPIPPARLLCPTWSPDRTHDNPLPHQRHCGDVAPSKDPIDIVTERLRRALDTAEALHLDLIDVHVCELRQLARWHIITDEEDVQRYLQPWTIDDADPVFPVPVEELRRMISALEALPPAHARPPRRRPPVIGRTLA